MDKLEAYYHWYEQQYANIISLAKLKEYAGKDKILLNAINGFDYRFSSIWRQGALNDMRYYIRLRKTEYYCTSFRLIRKVSSSLFLYNKKNYGIPSVNTLYAFTYTYIDDGTIKHEYVCTGPTYRSADGEYRHRFIPFWQISQLFNDSAVLQDIEEYLLSQLRKEDIKIVVSTTPNDKETKKIEKSIDKLRISIMLLAASWLVDVHSLIFKLTDNHISENYRETLVGIDDITYYNEIRDKYGPEIINPLLISIFRFRRDKSQYTLVTELGQKFIALTIDDVENTEDIDLPPWREIYITSKVGDLVINGVTPTFPIINDWFYIKGKSYDLWDNRISHIRLTHSDIGQSIVKEIEAARKGTYVIDPLRKQELYLSYNMENLSEMLNLSMDFAEEQIVLADLTLCIVSEFVGRTIADTPILFSQDIYALTNGPFYQKYSYFAHYIFDCCYGLYCLNKYYEIVHGDLHLNNVTLFLKRTIFNVNIGKFYVPEPSVIFNVEGKHYLFPHHGNYLCIIDFSRSFIGTEGLKKGGFSESQINRIISRQNKRIVRALERDIPDFYTNNKKEIEVMMIAKPDKVFKLIQALDIYKFSRGMKYLIETEILAYPERVSKYADENMLKNQAIPLLEKITSLAYQHLISIYEEPRENINLAIIKECFSSFLLEKNHQPFTLVDYFSSDNELRYNNREYDSFPPTIKLDYIKEHNIPTDQLKNYEEYLHYVAKEPIEVKIKDIQQKIIEEKPERRGSPPGLKPGHIATKKEIEDFKKSSSNISGFYYDT